MNKPWKIINKSNYKNIQECLKDLKKKTIISHWILDVLKNKKNKIFITNKKIKLYIRTERNQALLIFTTFVFEGIDWISTSCFIEIQNRLTELN